MAVKHAFTNPKSDGADTTVTRPSDWNAEHVGSSPPYLDSTTLDGTYGDEFTGASLDGKWTPLNVPAPGFQAGDGSHLFIDFSGVNPANITEPGPTTDEFDVIASFSHFVNAVDAMVGLYIVSSTGTGVGSCLRVYDATHLVYNLVSYAYDSIGVSTGLVVTPADLGAKLWMLFQKRSGLYVSRYSRDGTNWSRPVQYTPPAFTPAKIGIGRQYGSGEGSLYVDRINVLHALNLGANLVRSPSSGSATYTSSSDIDGGHTAGTAADGSYADGWCSAGGYPSWWNVAWSVGQTLNRVRLYGRPGISSGHVYIEVSDGSTTWAYSCPWSMASGAGLIDFPTHTGITSLKVYIVAGAGSYFGFAEVEAYLAS